MNLVDRIIATVAPERAVRRAHFRRVLSYYEAAKPSRYRKGRRENACGPGAVLRAGEEHCSDLLAMGTQDDSFLDF